MRRFLLRHVVVERLPAWAGPGRAQRARINTLVSILLVVRRPKTSRTRIVSAIAAASVIVAGISTGVAWAGGPGGVIEEAGDISVAVGTGVFEGSLLGFQADGATNDEASARVITACVDAGGALCTSDEVTNDSLCIVSVADDSNSVVAGGAGVTVEAARDDAFARALANDTPLSPAAVIVISTCP